MSSISNRYKFIHSEVISKIPFFCTKVGKGLCRSLLAETDFLSSAIYSSQWTLGKVQKSDILQQTAKCFCAFFVCFVGPTCFR